LLLLLGVSGADLEPDWCAFKAEGCADLVFEEAFEGEVEFDVAIGEQDEGWRSDRSLGHVEDADAFVHRHRGSLEVDFVEEAVHLAGGDTLAAQGCDALDLLEDFIEIGAFFC